MTKKFALITGVSGQDGAYLAKFLLKKEISVKKIDYINFEREDQIKKSFLFLKKINSYKAEICILTAPTKRLIIPLMISNSKNKIFFKKSKIKDLSKYINQQTYKIFPDIKIKKKYNLFFLKNNFFKKEIFLSVDSHHDQNNWKELNFINLTEKLLKVKKKIRKKTTENMLSMMPRFILFKTILLMPC